MGYKVLLINDKAEVFEGIESFNQAHSLHYQIEQVPSSVDISGLLSEKPVDLVIISCTITTPGKDNLSIIRELKLNASTSLTPIIMCTNNPSIEEQIIALNQGADDVFKTQTPVELLFSKMNAILRKIDKDRNVKELVHRRFYFDENTLEVEYHGHKYKLTNKEFIILKTLVDNPKKVFSQEDLNKLSSGESVFVSRRCIDTFITLLRNKLGKDCIVCIRKKGYKLNDSLFEMPEAFHDPALAVAAY